MPRNYLPDMRIHFTYRHVDKPWGGANNFIRALRTHLAACGGVEFTEPAEAPTDIMFMNQLGKGPGGDGRRYSLREVERLIARDRRKLVVRAVNLQRHAFPLGPRNLIFGTMEDRATMGLLELADMVIFQSGYQREVYVRAGYRGSCDRIVHNGAAPMYRNEAPATAVGDTLRVVSATASPRATKRHDLIAAVSRLPGVELMHFGAWPKGVAVEKVKLMGTCGQQELAENYTRAHYFLHTAIKDPCPNVLFEAICSGLPILYNPDQGSSREIVGDNGVALDVNDLASSLERARSELSRLQERVRATRDYYRIDRAMAAYADAFQAVVRT